MLRETELAASLYAGLKLETVMFTYYDQLLPRLIDLRARKAVAAIRLQELAHADLTDIVLKTVISSQPLYETSVTALAFAERERLAGYFEKSPILEMKLGDGMREAYKLERDYENTYKHLFVEVRDPEIKNRLMVMVNESHAHAEVVKRILESMGESV